MAENSGISWTHHTHNEWIGCQKVGPGCDHCYAEAWDARGLQGGDRRWGPHAARTRTSAGNRIKPYAWDKAAAKAGERHRVFCSSLADVFDNHASVLPEWREELWCTIRETKNLDWMLLTKRPGNIADMLPPDWGAGYPNVWLGCTVTNQAEADRDVPKLLAVPAAVRFVSVEPMLGPMDLTQYLYRAKMRALDAELRPHEWMIPKLDLVICGGESGPKARPMHFDWVRGLRDQCVGAGVAFHFKQWGEWIPVVRTDEIDARITMSGQNSDLWAWPDGISKDSWRNGPVSARVGTKRAGRTLDWRTWDEMPKQQEGIK